MKASAYNKINPIPEYGLLSIGRSNRQIPTVRMFIINKDTVRAHSFLPLLVIKSYIIPKMAKRTRKKGIINNVINPAPPIVLAIVYLQKMIVTFT